MRTFVFILLIMCSLSCGLPNENTDTTQHGINEGDFVQTIVLTVNGKKATVTNKEEVIIMSYVEQSQLGLSVMSEKSNIQLSISANLTDLKAGSYQVYYCRRPSDCDQQTQDKHQNAVYSPYPKDATPPINLFKMAYQAPALGLAPLTFTITTITDEQQSGVPWKTKRIKGHFNGTLAYVEGKDYDWHVVGSTTTIQGQFDVYCSLR